MSDGGNLDRTKEIDILLQAGLSRYQHANALI